MASTAFPAGHRAKPSGVPKAGHPWDQRFFRMPFSRLQYAVAATTPLVGKQSFSFWALKEPHLVALGKEITWQSWLGTQPAQKMTLCCRLVTVPSRPKVPCKHGPIRGYQKKGTFCKAHPCQYPILFFVTTDSGPLRLFQNLGLGFASDS